MLFGPKYNESIGLFLKDVLLISKNTYWQWFQLLKCLNIYSGLKETYFRTYCFVVFCSGCGNAST